MEISSDNIRLVLGQSPSPTTKNTFQVKFKSVAYASDFIINLTGMNSIVDYPTISSILLEPEQYSDCCELTFSCQWTLHQLINLLKVKEERELDQLMAIQTIHYHYFYNGYEVYRKTNIVPDKYGQVYTVYRNLLNRFKNTRASLEEILNCELWGEYEPEIRDDGESHYISLTIDDERLLIFDKVFGVFRTEFFYKDRDKEYLEFASIDNEV